MHSYDSAVPSDDDHVRDAVYAIRSLGTFVGVEGDKHLQLGHLAGEFAVDVLRLDVDCEHLNAVLSRNSRDAFEQRQLLSARATPGRPERNDHNLSGIACQRKALTVVVVADRVGRLVACFGHRLGAAKHH